MIEYWIDSWNRTPRPIRRLYWWWLLPLFGVVLLFALTALRVSTGYNPLSLLGPFQGLIAFAFQFLALAITLYKTGRVRRDFVSSGGRLCTRCGHSLKGLGDSGACPECGAAFCTESDRVAWGNTGITMNAAARARDTQPSRPREGTDP